MENNEINKPLLALLDENIADARKAIQVKEGKLQIYFSNNVLCSIINNLKIIYLLIHMDGFF